jgi:hypothetical protein
MSSTKLSWKQLEAADIRGNRVVVMVTNVVTSGNSFKLQLSLIDIAKKP